MGIVSRVVTKLPLPQIVCDSCGATCVYRKYDGLDEVAWLECTGCHKKWHNVGRPIRRQDAFIDSATATIKDVTGSAMEARRFSWVSSILASIRARLFTEGRP